MTWSLKPHGLRTEPPHVLWDGKFLPKLSDKELRKAIRAAESLGDDTVTTAAEGRGSLMVKEATLIVGAIIKEMGRRGWETEVGPSDATSDGGVAGSAANKSRQPINDSSEGTNP